MASETSYDFIVIGGGAAGLAVAARLSEDPSQNVLVLEAGADLTQDPRIRTPALCWSLLGSDADWGFQTEPQPTLNGRPIPLNQGKALGGGTATNIQVFIPPVPSLLDSWESLGNSGWNWETLRPYYAKTYTADTVDESLLETLGIDGWSTKSIIGDGPVKVSYGGNLSHPIRKVWADTFKGTGYYMPEDPFVNASVGSFSGLATIDAVKGERSDAATSYYVPIKFRRNLHVITNASVEKILFEGSGKPPRAKGVQYRHEGNVLKVATSKKEVILAAGAIQSPKILELSGIGSTKLLEKHDIKPIVDLPGVGENFHDHIMCCINVAALDKLETLDPFLRQEPEAVDQAQQEYAANRSGPLSTTGVYTFAFLPVVKYLSEQGQEVLKKLLSDNRPSPGSGPDTARQQAYYDVAEKTLLNPNQPSGAYVSYIGNNRPPIPKDTRTFTIAVMLSQPLSRGSVHIGSNSPSDAPIINPNYLSNPVDLEVFAHHMLHVESIVRTPPLSNMLEQPIVHRDPASNLTDLDTAKEWIRQTATSMWHPGGSCAMLPKEKNGVVDTNLKVYGVEGLRVVDSSAIPLISTGNLQATVYAFAEKAADIIKETWNLK